MSLTRRLSVEIGEQHEASKQAAEALEIARLLYRDGLDDYLGVCVTQVQALAAELVEVRLRVRPVRLRYLSSAPWAADDRRNGCRQKAKLSNRSLYLQETPSDDQYIDWCVLRAANYIIRRRCALAFAPPKRQTVNVKAFRAKVQYFLTNDEVIESATN
jgi:hypothetical protein